MPCTPELLRAVPALEEERLLRTVLAQSADPHSPSNPVQSADPSPLPPKQQHCLFAAPARPHNDDLGTIEANERSAGHQSEVVGISLQWPQKAAALTRSS